MRRRKGNGGWVYTHLPSGTSFTNGKAASSNGMPPRATVSIAESSKARKRKASTPEGRRPAKAAKKVLGEPSKKAKKVTRGPSKAAEDAAKIDALLTQQKWTIRKVKRTSAKGSTDNYFYAPDGTVYNSRKKAAAALQHSVQV